MVSAKILGRFIFVVKSRLAGVTDEEERLSSVDPHNVLTQNEIFPSIEWQVRSEGR
jgi:hypothetical protein